MKKEMSLIDIFTILKDRIKVILSVLLATVIVVMSLSFLFAKNPATYTSQVDFLVELSDTEMTRFQSKTDTINASINTYRDIITNDDILLSVIEELDLDNDINGLRANIEIGSAHGSRVFNLKVKDNEADLAADTANAIAETFLEEISEEDTNNEHIKIISYALPEEKEVTRNFLSKFIVSLIIGLIIGIGAAFLVEYLDFSLKSKEQLIQLTGWPIIGEIEKVKKLPNNYVVKGGQNLDD